MSVSTNCGDFVHAPVTSEPFFIKLEFKRSANPQNATGNSQSTLFRKFRGRTAEV